jgi:hypothetical protein
LQRSSTTEKSLGVTACARGAGIETVDLWDELTGLMREEPALHRSLYHRYGPRQDGWGHMTEAGNALIAKRVAQRLATQDWLPPAAP